MNSSNIFSDSKNHYEILDGLRGIAAITVVIFHIFEIFSGGNHALQIINHGYLAVDFFFLLSGFVIGHAYDDRWQKMTLREFFKRRLIRLHPMIVVGMIIGAIGFYFSASPVLFPLISSVPVWKLLLIMLIGFTLIPVPLSLDIRGWTEMHPLNGPAWSLFYEYVANILYAFVLRKTATKWLIVLTFLAACALVHLTVTSPNGDVIGGWALDPTQIHVGLTRLLFPFFAGLLLSRYFKPHQIRNAFVWSGVLLLLVLALPRIGQVENVWQNGLYEAFVIIFIFPLIIYIGANGTIESGWQRSISQFLGDISYPIYITHYPLIYIFSAWVVDNKLSIQDAWPVGILVLLASITIAYACLKLYDIPVRKWLASKSKAQ
ncbi:Peptidoglycan/LPS O-acetylase OafA/YrhL, contains acyltransferase and SGNH-hydrolase domains [Flexibacter flexilis DSM 6793]|uniref:Peptidoglycan/LPS O-acetylase OafA/YrhL, contains acyltransferase and SGNH-hydrolase domains n=1 Tax=Flexibacter flexilis DSM 6793 TaxID=927664 RepID=A0A1I1GUK7_9BACT|nr:acyltransferase [Flexibacter flexilis]SFC15519.1 Peptidoglycan/LPS O-acetylase OafA/YrhL, contains acyltransferase and SGNH-hydrolase domains [Flexibacter flexilis DSM 6793]